MNEVSRFGWTLVAILFFFFVMLVWGSIIETRRANECKAAGGVWVSSRHSGSICIDARALIEVKP